MLNSDTANWAYRWLPNTWPPFNVGCMCNKTKEFPQEKALVIQSRGEHWQEYAEELQWVLVEKVIYDQGTRDKLVSALRWCRPGTIKPDDPLVDDFANFLIDRWLKKAEKGTLVDTCDGESKLPESLLRKSFFNDSAHGFFEKSASKRLRPLEDFDLEGSVGNPTMGDGDTMARGSSYERLAEELHRIKLDFSGHRGTTRPVQMAGMQLFPRLDWAWAPHGPLKNKLVDVVQLQGDGDWDQLSRDFIAMHDEYQEKLGNELSAYGEKHNHGQGTQADRTAARVLSKRSYNHVFMPLPRERTSELLGCSPDNAHQIACRYRKALPGFLLKQIKELGEDFSDRFRDLLIYHGEDQSDGGEQ